MTKHHTSLLTAYDPLFQTGMRSAPHHGPLYRTYAEMEAKRGDYGAARLLYQRGIAADPFYAQLFHS